MSQSPVMLIVDDEAVTRRGLLNNVPWKALGVEKIIEAENGQQALGKLSECQPDILLTDIRMPMMNGIDLASEVKARLPECKIIFLSGFSDKEYLKAAIHLGAVDYVEKPIDIDELSKTVSKAVELYWEEVRKPIGMVDETTVKHSLVEKLIRSNVDLGECLPLLDSLGLKINENDLIFTLIIKVRDQDKGIQVAGIFHMLNQYLADEFGTSHIIGSMKDSKHLVWIVKSDSSYKSQLDHLKAGLMDQHELIVSQMFMSASDLVKGLTQVYKSYQDAVIGLQMLFFMGYGKMVTGHFSLGSGDLVFDENLISRDFRRLISQKDYDGLIPFVDQTMKGIRFNNGLVVNDLKNAVFHMCLALHNHAREEVAYEGDHNTDNPYLWEEIFRIETLEELKKFLIDQIDLIVNIVKLKENYSTSIRTVIQIIKDQYMDSNLSTKNLADQVYLTTSYLSGLFKKETGVNISHFIRMIRVEEAKKILRESKYSLREVSEMVGYTDANYFAKMFKKEVGRSPSDYRERQQS